MHSAPLDEQFGGEYFRAMTTQPTDTAEPRTWAVWADDEDGEPHLVGRYDTEAEAEAAAEAARGNPSLSRISIHR